MSSQWDITDPGAAERIVQRGDVVINCAAYTNVDGAETDEAAAFAVNATGPGHIAAACAKAGAQVIHVSTDYVFNGEFGGAQPRPYEPTDRTAPQSVYARSKVAGERAVLAALPEAVVVRTAWVYTGGTGKDFVAVMRRLAAGDGPVDVVEDQTGSPTYVGDLAAALLQIVDDAVPGPILHAANEGACSRFEQARAVFEECWRRPAARATGLHRPLPAARPTAGLLRPGQRSVRRGGHAAAAALAPRARRGAGGVR